MIEAGKHYRPRDREMRIIAQIQTLAAWRHQNEGPPYSKAGSGIVYAGTDILAWLKEHRVVPEAETAKPEDVETEIKGLRHALDMMLDLHKHWRRFGPEQPIEKDVTDYAREVLAGGAP